MHKKLFIPGPTEVRQDILEAQAQWMIGHRSKDFGAMNERIITKIKQALNTKNYAYVFTSSGTGVMEGSIRNCVVKDVLHTVNGAFSDRWFKISKACGKNADAITVPWGKAIKPEMVEEKLKSKKYEAFCLVQNETSTGVRSPIEEIASVMKKFPDVLWIIDTVSSLMGDNVEPEVLCPAAGPGRLHGHPARPGQNPDRHGSGLLFRLRRDAEALRQGPPDADHARGFPLLRTG
jgi:aspartate aminotransferase-like enzyme